MILRYPPLARAAPLVLCVVIVYQALAAGRGASFYGQAVPDLNAITQGGINGPGYDLFEGVHQAYERWANEQQAEDSRESYPALENGTPGDVEDKPLDLDSLTPEEREDLQNMEHGGLPPPESYADDPNSEQLPDKINTDTGTGAPDSDTGADTPGDNGAGASDTGGNSGAGGGEGGAAGEGGGGGGEGEGGGEGGGGGSD